MELSEDPTEREKQVYDALSNPETTSKETTKFYDAFGKYYDQASLSWILYAVKYVVKFSNALDS